MPVTRLALVFFENTVFQTNVVLMVDPISADRYWWRRRSHHPDIPKAFISLR